MNTIKKFMVGAALAGTVSMANAGLEFTVDLDGSGAIDAAERALIDGSGGILTTPATFKANGMSGSYKELITIASSSFDAITNTLSGTFVAELALDINDFDDALGTSVDSGVNTFYDVYSIITINGSYSVANVGGSEDLSINIGASSLEAFLDFDDDTDSDVSTGTLVINDVGGEDVKIATADLTGSAIFNATQGSFEFNSANFALEGVGFDFFTEPDPFHMSLNSDGTLDNLASDFVAAFNNGDTFFTVTQNTTASIQFVSEPSVVALLGLGLFGMAFASRRK